MTNLEKNFASVVVYCSNNASLVEPFITRISEYFSNKFEHFEIIFVDDCSNDESVAIALKTANLYERVILTVVNLSYPQGKEIALSAGVDISIGDFVYEFESIAMDFPDSALSTVYETCLEGYDIVAASPEGFHHFKNQIFFSLFNRGRGPLIPIETESFRILSRRAINRIGMVSGKIVYRKAVYYGCGLKTRAIQYTPLPHSTPQPPRKSVEELTLAINAILHFTNLGFRFALGASLLMMLFSVFGLIYAFGAYFLRNHLVEGWLTTMVFLSFGFLGVFTILAIVIKYLSLILEAIHKKQPFIIESVIKSNRN